MLKQTSTCVLRAVDVLHRDKVWVIVGRDAQQWQQGTPCVGVFTAVLQVPPCLDPSSTKRWCAWSEWGWQHSPTGYLHALFGLT